MVLPAEANRECESNLQELFSIAQNVHGQRLRFSLESEKVLAKVQSVMSDGPFAVSATHRIHDLTLFKFIEFLFLSKATAA